MDEMKVQENLVWDKDSGDMIGYVDSGGTDLNYDEVASHILAFLVRIIINPLKCSLANFATKNGTCVQMFPLFWKAVAILEENCKLKVVGVTSDGASAKYVSHAFKYDQRRRREY